MASVTFDIWEVDTTSPTVDRMIEHRMLLGTISDSIWFSVYRNLRELFYNSPDWKAARYEALRSAHWTCKCGMKANEVHHIEPLVKSPELALDQENLLPVCYACHDELEAEARAHYRRMQRRGRSVNLTK